MECSWCLYGNMEYSWCLYGNVDCSWCLYGNMEYSRCLYGNMETFTIDLACRWHEETRNTYVRKLAAERLGCY